MDEKDRLYQLCEKFEKHVGRFERHERKEKENFDCLVEAQQTNTAAITELTKSISTLVEDTSSMVKLTKDFQGAARLGKGLQGFILWLMRWGFIGIGLATGLSWIIDHFQN